MTAAREFAEHRRTVGAQGIRESLQPVWLDGRFVVDGSVVNAIPVSLCRAMGADIVIAVDLGSHMERCFPLDAEGPSKAGPPRRWVFNVRGPSKRPGVPPPSIMDALLGAIDLMQERIAQARLISEPPDVVLAPRLGCWVRSTATARR